MYASIRRFKSFATAEVLRKIKESFVPIITGSEGFVTYHLVQMEREFLSISIFETKQAAESSNAVALNWYVENIPSLLEGEMEFQTGELVVTKTK